MENDYTIFITIFVFMTASGIAALIYLMLFEGRSGKSKLKFWTYLLTSYAIAILILFLFNCLWYDRL